VTHDELVTRLTAAIDDRSVIPRIDGNASEPDEVVAERLLEDLLRYAPGTPATTPGSSTSGGTTPAERVALAYSAWDRAVRALQLMVLERCQRYPNAETDPRGNPIPEELRGQPVDGNIRAWDPETPMDEVPVEVGASGPVRYARDHGIDESVIESMRNCVDTYDQARYATLRTPWLMSGGGAGTRRVDRLASEYARAKAAAEAFVEYLDALAP
jgi:hypothetical protein